MPSSPLISAHELHDLLEAGPGIRLLDVRYRLDKPDGRDDYRAGHLPGAVYVDMDTELATHGAPSEGRHPLPSRATLQDAARRWGLHAGDAVVVYDDFRSVSAARAWWLLRGAGVATSVFSTAACRRGGRLDSRSRLATFHPNQDRSCSTVWKRASRSMRLQPGRSAEYCSTRVRRSATAENLSRSIPLPGTSPAR